MNFNILAAFNFISALFVLCVGTIVLFKNPKNHTNSSFFIFSIFIIVWLSSYGMSYMINDLNLKFVLLKVGFSSVIFIPVAFTIFAMIMINNSQRVMLGVSAYLAAAGFVALLWSTNILVDGYHYYSWGYYPRAGLGHPFFLLFLTVLLMGTTVKLFIEMHSGRLNQVTSFKLKYVAWALTIISMGVVDFIPNYGLGIYPFGWVFVCGYIFLIGYVIVRYRFLDITIAITRTSIWFVVYLVILGAPIFAVFSSVDYLQSTIGKNWWMIPMIGFALLSTVGPYIYLYFLRKAEASLLKEQRHYQNTLRQASMGMGRVKDLRHLLRLIVNIVMRTVGLENCSIFLYHEDANKYVLKANKTFMPQQKVFNKPIEVESDLIKEFKRSKNPIVYQEVFQKSIDFNDQRLKSIVKVMEQLHAEIVIPSFIEDRLIAVIILGRKRSHKPFSPDDLVVFSILANQAALSIENAQYYENMKTTHEQLFKAEKMATLGTMADGLSHQINNRLHAMGFIAGDALDTLKMKRTSDQSDALKEVFDDLEFAFDRIQDNVKRGGEIVGGLLKYSRKGTEGFEAVDLHDLLDAALEMVQFKIKLNQIDIQRNFADKIPKILGNFTQLQEVIFNIVDNSYDAMMQRRQEMSESGYQPKLEIAIELIKDKMKIIISDNGIGVKPDDVRKLFTPFFTTKLSSKKGTGLGLYVIRQIIESNHKGRVDFISDYRVGSRTEIILPLYTEENEDELNADISR